MATPKKNFKPKVISGGANAESKRIADQEMEEAIVESVEQSINFEEEELCFELLAGYVDESGTINKEFALREMTGKDEEAIHRADIKNNGSKAATVLLSRCCTRIGVHTPKSVGGRDAWEKLIRGLLTGDQDYMLLQLRRISIGEEIETLNQCPGCKVKIKTELELSELEIRPFKGDRTFPFTLSKGYFCRKKGEVYKTGMLRLPTGEDREYLTPMAKQNLAKAETFMLTRLVKFDSGYPVDDDVTGSLTVKDREYLQNLLRDNYFGVALEFDVECDQCGEVFKATLNVLSNFL